jgi:hypothetical protein
MSPPIGSRASAAGKAAVGVLSLSKGPDSHERGGGPDVGGPATPRVREGSDLKRLEGLGSSCERAAFDLFQRTHVNRDTSPKPAPT